MLRRARAATVRFLVPNASLGCTSSRFYRKSTQQPTPVRYDPALFERIKEHVTCLHSADGRGPSDSEVEMFNQTVVQLQKALKDRHLPAVSEYWSVLSRQNLGKFLGPSQLERFSRSIVRLWPAHGPDGSWEERDRRAIEDIALVAAARRAPDALNAVLISHLRRQEPEAVLEMHRRYLELSEQSWEREVEEASEEGSYEALASTSMSVGDHRPGRVTLLLSVVTAHAMMDSFSNALGAYRNANVRFTPSTVKEYLKYFRSDLRLQQKVMEYSGKLGIARLVTRSPSLIKHIGHLSNNPSVRPIERFYGAIVDGLTGPNAYLTTEASSGKVVVTEVAWTSFLSGFMKHERLDLAEKVWDDVVRLGVRTGVSLWTALFDGYDRMRATGEAVTGWKAMESQGVKPDALTYRALISTLFHGKKADVAMGYFKRFEEELAGGCIRQDGDRVLRVYNTVLHGLLESGREEEGMGLFGRMKGEGPKPDVVSYNTLLKHHGRRGDFRSLAGTIREMTGGGVAGDVFTFSTILTALLKVGRTDAPDMVLELMAKQGIEPNVATFTAIIDQLMREQDGKSFQAALRVLERMEENPESEPNEVTYTAILAGIYRGRWLERGVAEECGKEIVQRMKKRGVRPSALTYDILQRDS